MQCPCALHSEARQEEKVHIRGTPRANSKIHPSAKRPQSGGPGYHVPRSEFRPTAAFAVRCGDLHWARVGWGVESSGCRVRDLSASVKELDVSIDREESLPVLWSLSGLPATGCERSRKISRLRRDCFNRQGHEGSAKKTPAHPRLRLRTAGNDSDPTRQSGLRNSAASGGRVSFSEYGRACTESSYAVHPPRLPIPLPPYSLASLLSSSRQKPPWGTPT